jgi:hypothetical protein
MFCAAQAHAGDDGKEIPCADSPFKFDAPGFTTKCRDHSGGAINLDVSGAERLMTLHGFSSAEATFIDVIDDRILGTTRVYFNRGTLQSDVSKFYSADFSDWASDPEIGGYEVMRVSVSFDKDDPMDCVAFRKLGARRYSGVGAITVGLACSALGREHAYDALKHLAQS